MECIVTPPSISSYSSTHLTVYWGSSAGKVTDERWCNTLYRVTKLRLRWSYTLEDKPVQDPSWYCWKGIHNGACSTLQGFCRVICPSVNCFESWPACSTTILPILLLQKPGKRSKAKDHSNCLQQWLNSWKDGNFNDFFGRRKNNNYNNTFPSIQNPFLKKSYPGNLPTTCHKAMPKQHSGY